MGYYDFNDHFWSPHEACKQKSTIVAQEEQLSVVGKLSSWLRSLNNSNLKSSEPENQCNLPNVKSN
ncbi:MAG: hypothetical protein AAGA80_02415 [Cyanobacteria bacterium P01_F01_bin.143]